MNIGWSRADSILRRRYDPRCSPARCANSMAQRTARARLRRLPSFLALELVPALAAVRRRTHLQRRLRPVEGDQSADESARCAGMVVLLLDPRVGATRCGAPSCSRTTELDALFDAMRGDARRCASDDERDGWRGSRICRRAADRRCLSSEGRQRARSVEVENGALRAECRSVDSARCAATINARARGRRWRQRLDEARSRAARAIVDAASDALHVAVGTALSSSLGRGRMRSARSRRSAAN
jgi:hypothetical protein